MGKRQNDYYLMLSQLADLGRQGAEGLQRALERHFPRSLSSASQEAEDRERRARELRRDFTRRLLREFVPPMDREDLLELCQRLEALLPLESLCLARFQGDDAPGLSTLRAAERLVRGCTLLKEAADLLGDRDRVPLLERTEAAGSVAWEGERLALRSPALVCVLSACRAAADCLERAAVKN